MHLPQNLITNNSSLVEGTDVMTAHKRNKGRKCNNNLDEADKGNENEIQIQGDPKNKVKMTSHVIVRAS